MFHILLVTAKIASLLATNFADIAKLRIAELAICSPIGSIIPRKKNVSIRWHEKSHAIFSTCPVLGSAISFISSFAYVYISIESIVSDICSDRDGKIAFVWLQIEFSL